MRRLSRETEVTLILLLGLALPRCPACCTPWAGCPAEVTRPCPAGRASASSVRVVSFDCLGHAVTAVCLVTRRSLSRVV
ncbi:hypothetical protein [Carbonactinospora thermoautotrophica]|uniref:hypothetical protein n=1 Tax=Carbonactinospora thermoautotrophica TaxID=1469144 RepID=UPI00227094B5|nr:hypothetical protein [Carbonactinospora thermoautotrophica]